MQFGICDSRKASLPVSAGLGYTLFDGTLIMKLPVEPSGTRGSLSVLEGRAEALLSLLILAATVVVAHFMRFAQFGFYEDDYWSIANSMGLTGAELWARAQNYFQAWPTGRPLNHLLPNLLSFVGVRLGGVEAMYALAAGGLLLNAWLVNRIARQLLPGPAALAAGVTYVLFPPDTTRQLLIHVSHVQGAMTFSLLGLLLWRRAGISRLFSYPIAGLSLLSYETAYIPFLCAPLLLAGAVEFRRRLTWAAHAAGCSIVLGLVMLARALAGGAHSSAHEVLGNPSQAAFRALTSMYLGPLTDVKAFLHAFWEGGRHVDVWAIAGAMMIAALLVVWHLYYSDRRVGPGVADETAGGPQSTPIPLPIKILALWPASYVLTLVNYPPTQIAGRMTSTHTAAALPVALLAGSLYATFAGRSRAWRTASHILLVAGLFLTLSYNQFVQREYARAWQVQIHFWQQVFELCPDVDARTGILVTGGVDPEGSEIIAANSWADYHAYRWLFGAGSNGDGPRFAHLGVLQHSVPFRRGDSGVEWMPEYWGGPYMRIDSNQLILLRSEQGRLSRVSSIDTSVGLLTTTRPIPTPGARMRFYMLLRNKIGR